MIFCRSPRAWKRQKPLAKKMRLQHPVRLHGMSMRNWPQKQHMPGTEKSYLKIHSKHTVLITRRLMSAGYMKTDSLFTE
jgi:hypothetical protein